MMNHLNAFIEEKVKAIVTNARNKTLEDAAEKKLKAKHTPDPEIALHRFECNCKLVIEDSKKKISDH